MTQEQEKAVARIRGRCPIQRISECDPGYTIVGDGIGAGRCHDSDGVINVWFESRTGERRLAAINHRGERISTR